MSKRRTAGDIVWKKENAGFVGESSLVQIRPEKETKYGVAYCMLECGDEDCREWHECWECDKDGKHLGGVACHVSECQMEDAPSEEQP